MIYKIVADVTAEGLIENELAGILAPELRFIVLEARSPSSWKLYFETAGESPEQALGSFRETFAQKMGLFPVAMVNETAVLKG